MSNLRRMLMAKIGKSDVLDKLKKLGIPVTNYNETIRNYNVVDYLQSNGTNYLALKPIPTHPKLALDAKFLNAESGLSCYFGVATYNSTGSFLVGNHASSIWRHMLNTYGSAIIHNTSGNERHKFIFDMNNIRDYIVDGIKYSISPSYFEVFKKYNILANCMFGIFGSVSLNGTVNYLGKSQCYSLVVEDSDTNVISSVYIPCVRKSDNKPVMLDMVSMEEYVNPVSGEDFSVGSNMALIDKIDELLVM